MAWNNAAKRVHNYGDGLNSGQPLDQKVIEGVLRTRCRCGRWVQAHRIVDTSDLPNEVTNGQDWACDNCWTSWIRHDPNHQRTHLGKPFRILNWLELHGAPVANIARQLARDKVLHTKMFVKRQGIIDRAEISKSRYGLDKELARIDDNINRMLDAERLP